MLPENATFSVGTSLYTIDYREQSVAYVHPDVGATGTHHLDPGPFTELVCNIVAEGERITR